MMKKKAFIMIIIFMLILIPINTKAITNIFESNLVVIEDNIETTGELTLNIDINVLYKLKGYSAKIKYDKSKLDLIEITDEDKFDITSNINYDGNNAFLSGVYNKGKEGKFTIACLKFKKTDNFKTGDKVEITLYDIKGSEDTYGIDNSITVSIPGIMKVNSITVDDKDITKEKKYITTNDEVNIKVFIDYGKVISGTGKVKLQLGETKHIIVIEDERGEKKNIELILVREKIKNTTTNRKNNIIKNANTGDSIYKIIIIGLVSVITSIISIFYVKRRV